MVEGRLGVARQRVGREDRKTGGRPSGYGHLAEQVTSKPTDRGRMMRVLTTYE
jgi:hypothetical protein